MPSTYQLLLNGQPADADLYAAISSLEVEESLDLPGAVQLTLPVGTSASGDLTYVSDSRFQPMANLAVVATPSASSAAGLARGGPGRRRVGAGRRRRRHPRRRSASSTGTSSPQAAPGDRQRELHPVGLGPGRVVADESPGDRQGVDRRDRRRRRQRDLRQTTASRPSGDNLADDSPSHTESGHSLMQRGSDIQFLRTLARRNGKFCRVYLRRSARPADRVLRQAETRRRPGGRPVAQRPPGVDGHRARRELGRDPPHVGHRPAGALHRQRRGRRLGRHVRLRPARRWRAAGWPISPASR